jgi:lysozyme family protein
VNFDSAFAMVVWQETAGSADGGYVSPEQAIKNADPGGETKYGISKRAFPAEDIKALTLPRAKELAASYWRSAHCDELPAELRGAVFDCAFNQGPGTAIELLQRALDVQRDGVFGRATRSAMAKWIADELLDAFMAERAMRYIGTRNFDRNGRGWFRRLFDVTRKVCAQQ